MITIGSVALDRLIEHSSVFWLNRSNQKTQESVTGSFITFDNSRTVLEGVIEIRLVTYAQAVQLRDFITNTIRFKRFTFDIIPESYDDLGLGQGVTITAAYFNGGETTQGVIVPFGKANKFNIKFPYRKAIDPTVANVDYEGIIA